MSDEFHRLFEVEGVTVLKIRELLAEGDRAGARDQYLAKLRQHLIFAWSPRCAVRNGNILDLLDLDRPELSAVKKAGQADDALAALAQYFRERPWPNPTGSLLPHDPAARQALREKALRGELDAAMAAPARMRLQVACQAHALTSEWKFADAIDRLIPALAQEPSIEALMDFFFEPSAVDYLLRHDVIDFRRVCDLLLVWYHYTEQVNQTVHLPEPAVPEYAGNHYFWMLGYAQLFAMLFPEFKRAEVLQYSLWARYADELSRQVAPDGTMIEMVPHYEDCCISWTAMLLRFARANGLPVPELVYRPLERMYQFALLFMRPDRKCPALGDSENDDVFAWHRDAREFFPQNALIQSLLTDRAGSAPVTSVDFPYAGYYVMRGGWEPEALYLMLDAGRYGQGHHHEDKLHIELMAFGRPFLVDAGRFTYDYSTPARQWAVTSAAHNTLLVDGAGQCRWKADRLSWYNVNAPVGDTAWETTPDYDEATGKYDLADGPFERPLPEVEGIERTIRFIKPAGDRPGCWLVTDIVHGAGTHAVDALFHFHPDNAVVIDGRSVRTANPDANLLILALGDGPLKIGLFRGRQQPFRGWFSSTYGNEVPAFEAEFHSKGELPLRRDYLLLPYRGPEPPAVVIEAYSNSRVCLAIGGLPVVFESRG